MVNAITFCSIFWTSSGQKPSFWPADHCSSHCSGRRATSKSRGGSAESVDRSYMSVGRSAAEKSPSETRWTCPPYQRTCRDSIFNWPLRPTGSIAANQTFSDGQVDPAWPSEVVADGLTPAEHPPRPGKRIQSRKRQKPETRRHGSRAAAGDGTAGHLTNLTW
jgi:hypothetical protein